MVEANRYGRSVSKRERNMKPKTTKLQSFLVFLVLLLNKKKILDNKDLEFALEGIKRINIELTNKGKNV